MVGSGFMPSLGSCCAYITVGLAMAYYGFLKCCNCREGWLDEFAIVKQYRAATGAKTFEPFRVMVCLHRAKFHSHTDPSNAFAWCLTRPSGKGKKKPTSAQLKENPDELDFPTAGKTVTAKQWPDLVDLQCVSSRSELQIAIYDGKGKDSYVGSVCVDILQEFVQSADLPEKKKYEIMGKSDRSVGSVVLSFYTHPMGENAFANDGIPLRPYEKITLSMPILCALKEAEAQRLEINRNMPETRPQWPQTKVHILASLLTGNFMALNLETSRYTPRYFEMKAKEDPDTKRIIWFWCQYRDPFDHPGQKVPENNPQTMFIPLRAIKSVAPVQTESGSLIVQYQRKVKKSVEQDQMFVSVNKKSLELFDCARSRDVIVWAFRNIKDALEEQYANGDDEEPHNDEHDGGDEDSDASKTVSSSEHKHQHGSKTVHKHSKDSDNDSEESKGGRKHKHHHRETTNH